MKFEFNRFYLDANNKQKWEQIRLWRNAELSQTDWTQLPDSPVDKDALGRISPSIKRFT
jgi:hypothetical protein